MNLTDYIEPKYEVVNCAFTLVDTAENIEKFLENKNVVVLNIREDKDIYSFNNLFSQLMTYSTLMNYSMNYGACYNFDDTDKIKYKVVVFCMIQKLVLNNTRRYIDECRYQIDYEHILKYINDEW